MKVDGTEAADLSEQRMRAILSVEQQVGVMKSAVEGRLGVKLETLHPAIAWMVEHAVALLNRFEVSHDVKTALERNQGKNKSKDSRGNRGPSRGTTWPRRSRTACAQERRI